MENPNKSPKNLTGNYTKKDQSVKVIEKIRSIKKSMHIGIRGGKRKREINVLKKNI